MLADKGAGPAVYYAGHNVSGTYHAKLLEELQGKDVCICVISKSGTTIESNIAFARKDLRPKNTEKKAA